MGTIRDTTLISGQVRYITSDQLHVDVQGFLLTSPTNITQLSFFLQTFDLGIEITELLCSIAVRKEWSFKVEIEPVNSTRAKSYLTTQSGYSPRFAMITVSTPDSPVYLLSNTKYNITVSCDINIGVKRCKRPVYKYPEFSLEFEAMSRGGYASPVNVINYKTLTPVYDEIVTK